MKWNQWVDFWKIGGRCSSGNIIGDSIKILYVPLAVLPVAGDVDQRNRSDVTGFHVLRIEEDDSPSHADSPIAIVETIDGSVVLIMASQALQYESVFSNLKLINFCVAKFGFA